jgi:hypothetical protein
MRSMLRARWLFVGGIGGGALLAALILAACQSVLAAQKPAVVDGVPERVSYNWDVRPILAQNCFSCHGMDAKQRKAGLRLDDADVAHGKLPQNPRKRAVVPGAPGKSELYLRITAKDADVRMPPVDSHKTLSAHDVAVIKRWIEQGAKYERHWAYLPVREARPRRTEWDRRAVNPIDRYVYARLGAHGLAPAAEADRETLINRVSMDLTGLPPTLAEVDAFVADKSPDAYEKVVDRLLASPAYAERMASTWMDTARYADTNGYLFDGFSGVQYPYRDWVISAFQRNIPYDKFVTWQIAGDLLPNPTREQILATAFARAGKKSNEGGIIDEEYRVEYVNERAELMGTAFLGLTVQCAKCHDHKYDVISQKDYYSLGAFFNSVDEGGMQAAGPRVTPNGPTLAWPSAEQARVLAQKHAVVQARQAERDAAFEAARQAAARGAATDPAATVARSVAQAQQAYYPMETWDRNQPFDVVLNLLGGGGRNSAPAPAQRNARGGERAKGGPELQRVAMKAAPEPATPAAPPARPLATPPGRIAQDDLDAALAKAQKLGLPLKSLPQDKRGYLREKMVWSHSGVPGAPPAVISNGRFVAGPPGKGKALLVEDTVAEADKGVGLFDRTEPFSFDLWIRLDPKRRYDHADILHRGATDGLVPGAGYRLSVVDNRLRFILHNNQPYNSVEVITKAELPAGRWIHVAATYDGSSKAAGTKLYVDGAEAPSEVLHDRLTRTILPAGAGRSLYNGLAFGRQFAQPEFTKGGIDELRVFTRALTPVEVAWLNAPASLSKMKPREVRDQLDRIAAERDPRMVRAQAALKAALDDEQKAEAKVPQVLVLADRRQPRKSYLLERGVYDQHGPEVSVQALPRVFPFGQRYPKNRLGLAEWMFDPKHPLTARVYVNRLWQMHFGTGIVETVEDFGTQGANPTNPELLDYLAAEFLRSGWDIRHMNKLIVMSATYRQSSTITPDGLKLDPRNLYLARGPRYRLPAEMIRDNALAASGLLLNRVGGDSVFPYHPQAIWGETGFGYQAYPDDVPADQFHRRSLYSFVKRNAEFPSLAVFDLADRNASHPSRRISNTPLQSLVLLNDPQYREAYRKLAERVMKTTPAGDPQLTALFRLSTRRRPTPAELQDMRTFRDSRLARFAAHPDDARKLTAIGVAPVDPSVDRIQLAALSEVAAAVLNSPDAYSLH